jgi:hypothetical protein
MALITVRFKPTGEVGTIPDNEFDPSIYEPLDGQQSQQPGFLMNLLTDLSRPFTNTAKKGAAAVETLGLLASSPAFRKQMQGQQLTPEEVKQLAQYKPAFSETGKNVSRGERALSSARDVAGIASWAVPFGKGASVASRALLPGAATGGLQAFSAPNAGLGEVAGGAATGAITAGVLDKLLGGAKRAAESARKGAAGVDQGTRQIREKASIFGASKEKAINATLDKYVGKGTAATQYANLEPGFNKIEGEIGEYIANNADDVIEKSSIVDKFKEGLKSALRSKDLTNKQATTEITGYLDDLVKATGGTESNVLHLSQLRELKKLINQDYGAVHAILERGGSLSPRQKVIAVAWDSLDDAVKEVAPKMKELLSNESNLYRAAHSLSSARSNAPTLRFMGTSLPASATQAGRDVLSGGLNKTAGGLEKILNVANVSSGGLEKILPGLSNVPTAATIGATRGLTGPTQQEGQPQQPQVEGIQSTMSAQQPQQIQQENEEWTQDPQTGQYVSVDGQWIWNGQQWTPNQQGQQTRQGNVPTQDEFKQAILQDMMQGGKNITKIKSVMDIFYPSGSGGELSATQQKRLSTLNMAEGIYNTVEDLALAAPTGLYGYGRAKFGKLPGVEGGAAEDLDRTTLALAKGIAGALASEVGVATDKDIERWMGLMPKVTDTMAERKRALLRLKTAIASSKNMITASQEYGE